MSAYGTSTALFLVPNEMKPAVSTCQKNGSMPAWLRVSPAKAPAPTPMSVLPPATGTMVKSVWGWVWLAFSLGSVSLEFSGLSAAAGNAAPRSMPASRSGSRRCARVNPHRVSLPGKSGPRSYRERSAGNPICSSRAHSASPGLRWPRVDSPARAWYQLPMFHGVIPRFDPSPWGLRS